MIISLNLFNYKDLIIFLQLYLFLNKTGYYKYLVLLENSQLLGTLCYGNIKITEYYVCLPCL